MRGRQGDKEQASASTSGRRENERLEVTGQGHGSESGGKRGTGTRRTKEQPCAYKPKTALTAECHTASARDGTRAGGRETIERRAEGGDGQARNRRMPDTCRR